MTSYVTYLESAVDGTRFEPGHVYTTHEGRPLWVRYDLDAVKKVLTKEKLLRRPATLWRYRELLPPEHDESIVSLGEGMTPLVPTPRLGEMFGLSDLWVKDESQLPTGTFKSRGQATAISMARELGIKRVAMPTAGNAGGAMAAYAARAGIEAYVFMPDDTPEINQYECAIAGARVFLVNGLIDDCGKIVAAGTEPMGWLSIATLKEPYRLEGKKTMGLELAEQLDWRLPDVILYPTGGGTGLIGMWKAFQELREMGWLESDKMPRMVAVQSDGCSPMVNAFEKGERFATRFENAATIASGLRVPAAVGDFMILDTVRESSGLAVAVAEGRIREWMAMAASLEGLSVGPEAATCVGAAEQLTASGWIQPNEQVVIYNCGASQKYPDVMRTAVPRIDINDPLDWERIMSA
ncbi:MAG: threonine synthase [Candidatus Promineifilaceae bacterium]|nr:threonine synthase [Candidatus Promineifilaceae bacterium]